MNNEVVFAAAGNGKTYSLCQKARESIELIKKKILLLSYTHEGVESIKNEYRKQNGGIIDERVEVLTWFSFLLQDCIRPYQSCLKFQEGCLSPNYINSIDFYSEEDKNKDGEIIRYPKKSRKYYINGRGDIRKNVVSDLAYECQLQSKGKVIERLEEIYDSIYIDELQDYAGWDLELFKLLFASKINIFMVGDPRQITYKTNNSSKNKKYRDEKIVDFFRDQEGKGVCQLSFNLVSRRCSDDICFFANTVYSEHDVDMVANQVNSEVGVEYGGVYVFGINQLSKFCSKRNLLVLRWDKSTEVKFEHSGRVLTYGTSKGLTSDCVIIIPTKNVREFLERNKIIESAVSKAKLYVACTRAKNTLIFAVDNFIKTDGFIEVNLNVDGEDLKVFKYKKG